MRVGDVLIDPRGARVHIVYDVLGADSLTAPVGKDELAQWAGTPECEREDWTVALERHDNRELAKWSQADETVAKLARQFTFADAHTCLLPCEDLVA